IIALSIALISGIYPAFKLATIHPLRSLKLNAFYFTPTNKGKGWFSMRNMLTCIQLMVSAFTILCILIISKQLNFIENKDLGIDTNGLIVTPVHRSLDTEELQLFKSKLYENSQINSASTSHTFPGRRFPFLTFKFPYLNRSGLVQPTEQDGSIWMRTLIGDHDVINTFGLHVVKGRDFTKRYASGDDPMEFIINEAAAEFLGLSDPVGETVVFTYDVEVPLEGKVIGVVEDFNYASLHNQIEPVIIFPSDRYQMYLSISFNSIQSNRAIRHTEEVWREQMGNVPFRYSILDDEFKSHYRSESHLKTLLSWLTIISILIAVVGLIGMSFYSMEKRKYEVGIRKVLGASVNSILRLNLKEYIRLALISNVLIIPVVVFFGRSWLDNFAYSVDLDLPLFVSGFVISFFVVLASVSFNVLKSTFANPTEMIDHR
ncbi:MAG: FtsX-like permease family protein, partial [Bacteroidota bacterium]